MTALPTFNAGTEPTAASWQTLLPILARRTTDGASVNNSTTLVNDAVLIWTLSNTNVVYDFQLRMGFTSNTTANWKYAFTFPAGCRFDFSHVTYNLGGAANTADLRSFVNYTSGTAISVSGAGSDTSYVISGTLAVASTTGSLQLQYAQNTANVSNSFTRAGSVGILRQVG